MHITVTAWKLLHFLSSTANTSHALNIKIEQQQYELFIWHSSISMFRSNSPFFISYNFLFFFFEYFLSILVIFLVLFRFMNPHFS